MVIRPGSHTDVHMSTPSARWQLAVPGHYQGKKTMCDSSFKTLFHIVYLSASLCLSSDAASTVSCLRPQETGCQESDLVHSNHLCKMNTKSLCQGTVFGIRSSCFIYNSAALCVRVGVWNTSWVSVCSSEMKTPESKFFTNTETMIIILTPCNVKVL